MHPIDFSDEDKLILSPCDYHVLAKDQLGYTPLPIARLISNPVVPVVSKWQPTEDERKQIAEGGAIYLTHYSFGHTMMPVALTTAVPLFEGEQSKVQG